MSKAASSRFSRRGMRRKQPPYPEVRLGAQCFRDQRIGSLLNAVVHKFVRTRQALDELLTDGLPQIQMECRLGGPKDNRKRPDLSAVAETASCCKVFCVSAGRQFNSPTIRSTTLSV